jgi:hypothetical protein
MGSLKGSAENAESHHVRREDADIGLFGYGPTFTSES